MTTFPESKPESQVPVVAGAKGWSPECSAALYGVPGWSGGYFAVGDRGHLLATPSGPDADEHVDLAELVEGLKARGIGTPALVRFPGILRHRLEGIRRAFDRAIEQNDYRGAYSCVYPIKVNQQRHLVEELRDAAATHGFGLEAGSKPELLAVLGLTRGHNDMPIVCNGFKDDEYVETVILAKKLGRNITPVVESFHELELIVSHAERYGLRPCIGIRIKPASGGSGKWAESAGERSKFGLHLPEVLAALDWLKVRGMEDCLKLVHFHIGSQVCDIRQMKGAVSELARIYCELRRLGAGLDTIDVGGGLAVDYDGSNSTWASSMNYTLDEYAGDLVHRVRSACDAAGQPHPRIITESGRAMVAHSSVLLFDVVGRTRFRADPDRPWIERLIAEEHASEDGDVAQPVKDLLWAWDSLVAVETMEDRAAAEAYHDALKAKDEALSLFELGYLSLPMRAVAERLFWAIGRRVLSLTRGHRDEGAGLPDQIEGLPRQLSDIYFGNFSVFQSLPDHWAIDHVFPVCPIHRLDERPTRRAVIADMTCDSDGTVDKFPTRESRDYDDTLLLHTLKLNDDGSPAEPYHLGIFLVGAYQEVLGDLHNLFGDVHVVHVEADPDPATKAGWRIDEVIEGDTVREVLGYVQYDVDGLRKSVRAEAESAVRAGQMTVQESRSLLGFYNSGLEGYTYLE
ncbi:MAG: biosynthetic arginine decarboxylase [Planctomycetota bacterium]